MGRIFVEGVSLRFKVSALNTRSFKDRVLTKVRTGEKLSSTFQVLDGVSFEVGKGEAIALVGHNGSGKSTLLRVLAGIYRPDSGAVHVEGRVAPLIELSAGFDAELSGAENVYLACTLMGLDSEEIDEKFHSILTFSELEDQIHLPFKNFSSGMQARLAFACATAVNPQVLLVDEVLSVGDMNFQRKCYGRVEEMRDEGTTLVLVSHDQAAIQRFCPRSLLLEHGRVLFDGATRDALALYREKMDSQYSERAKRLAGAGKVLSKSDRESLQEESRRLVQDGFIVVPKVEVAAAFLQEGLEENPVQPDIDFARPFEIAFTLTPTDVEHFRPPLVVGFAMHTRDDVRVGGANTQMLDFEFPMEKITEGKPARVRFPFPAGLPHLSPGQFFLVCGVHDQALAREIFIKRLLDFSARNSRLGQVEFTDIVDLRTSMSRVDFDASARG